MSVIDTPAGTIAKDQTECKIRRLAVFPSVTALEISVQLSVIMYTTRDKRPDAHSGASNCRIIVLLVTTIIIEQTSILKDQDTHKGRATSGTTSGTTTSS